MYEDEIQWVGPKYGSMTDKQLVQLAEKIDAARKRRKKERYMAVLRPLWKYVGKPLTWPVRFSSAQVMSGLLMTGKLALTGGAAYGAYELWNWLQPAVEVLAK